MKEEWYKVLKKKAKKIAKPYTDWAKEEGFTHIKQNDISARYLRIDKDGFVNRIKWHYDESSDTYRLVWQSWIGDNKERPNFAKLNLVTKRKDGIYLEAEHERCVFSVEQFASYKMLTYIKENNDKMIGLCKDNINKRLKKHPKNLQD